MNKPSAPGTLADLHAKVDISKVHGGYFANPINTDAFIHVGIEPIEEYLAKRVGFVDFGGGQGQLASAIGLFLRGMGHEVKATVVDANETYLAEASGRGLLVEACNLESCDISNLDFAVMRAVLHYNSPEKQLEILQNVYRSIKTGGYFVHQVSSGSEANARLRSGIVNELIVGRVGVGQYHWTSEGEVVSLHKKAGFTETEIVGYAPPCAWSPEEQWERKNPFTVSALGDESLTESLAADRAHYLDNARLLIEKYLKEFGPEESGIERKSDGSYLIHYTYPIVVSRK